MIHLRVQMTLKAVNKFLQKTYKNFMSMRKTISKIWLIMIMFMITAMTACNVTRKTTTESSFYQKGDTAVHISTKTVETYDATKKM